MTDTPIAIDLKYGGVTEAAASFVFKGDTGYVLVESGPLATLETLKAGLLEVGVDPASIKAVFLTHIHLDHAGAAGWFADHGADIYVHAFGVKHLIDPSKINESARRIYGERLSEVSGEMLPCPASKVHAVAHSETISVDGLEFTAIETPGHARHHHAWSTVIDGRTCCFTGDVAGMRIPGTSWVTLPLAPPEFDPAIWLQSLDQLEAFDFDALYLTHFGIVDDPRAHLSATRDQIDWETAAVTGILEDQSLDHKGRKAAYLDALHTRATANGISQADCDAYLGAGMVDMNLGGVQRYLDLRRKAEDETGSGSNAGISTK
ncbi:MAG: MBL fold metallo-hydrolase [Phycisphaera sp. TMED9]|nr:MAG: MBL fold metallo-hydrolase [Phycisphaera sp. TMED9]